MEIFFLKERSFENLGHEIFFRPPKSAPSLLQWPAGPLLVTNIYNMQ